jgi:hypothetical protein
MSATHRASMGLLSSRSKTQNVPNAFIVVPVGIAYLLDATRMIRALATTQCIVRTP